MGGVQLSLLLTSPSVPFSFYPYVHHSPETLMSPEVRTRKGHFSITMLHSPQYHPLTTNDYLFQGSPAFCMPAIRDCRGCRQQHVLIYMLSGHITKLEQHARRMEYRNTACIIVVPGLLPSYHGQLVGPEECYRTKPLVDFLESFPTLASKLPLINP